MMESGSGSAAASSAERRVLYRCRTPTNFLCPCGAVARKLKQLDLPYRTERVPQRRRNRPEIVELTRQALASRSAARDAARAPSA
jgi:hypothetical protein